MIDKSDKIEQSRKRVVIFAGNNCTGDKKDFYLDMACRLGKQLASSGYVVVTGAGDGMMEAVARGAHEAGGKTIGIGLKFGEAGTERTQSVHIHEYSAFDKLGPRQEKMISLGDAYVALPGGVGTVFEILNILALKRLDELPKPRPLVLLGDYYRPIAELMRHMVGEGFLEREAHDLCYFASGPEDAVRYISEKFLVRE